MDVGAVHDGTEGLVRPEGVRQQSDLLTQEAHLERRTGGRAERGGFHPLELLRAQLERLQRLEEDEKRGQPLC